MTNEKKTLFTLMLLLKRYSNGCNHITAKEIEREEESKRADVVFGMFIGGMFVETVYGDYSKEYILLFSLLFAHAALADPHCAVRFFLC